MSSLVWSEELTVEIVAIDAEHRRIFELLKKLHDAIVRGSTRNVMNSIVADLLKTAELHFDNEEKLMKDVTKILGQLRPIDGL